MRWWIIFQLQTSERVLSSENGMDIKWDLSKNHTCPAPLSLCGRFCEEVGVDRRREGDNHHHLWEWRQEEVWQSFVWGKSSLIHINCDPPGFGFLSGSVLESGIKTVCFPFYDLLNYWLSCLIKLLYWPGLGLGVNPLKYTGPSSVWEWNPHPKLSVSFATLVCGWMFTKNMTI